VLPTRPSRRRRPAEQPRRALFPADREFPQGFLHPPPPYPQLAGPFLLPPSRPSPGNGSRGGHLPWPPACPLAGAAPPPSDPPNRTIVSPRPPPHPPPAELRRPRPEFHRSRAGRPSQGPHCKDKFLFEGLPAIGNSNSKSALDVSCKLRRKL
jgi:hypothetical protein